MIAAARMRLRIVAAAALLLWALAGLLPVQAASQYYDLKPQKIAADTYALIGKRENFSFDNHGNICNTGFIVTDDGVVVIDTGPSRLYGEAMRAAIGEVTDKPVVQVYITHAHPDHFLGNNAFTDVPIAALPGTIDAIRSIGSDLASNLYNLVGAAMRGTSAVAPTATVEPGQTVTFGNHELQLIGASGHTAADLMVLDRKTGVLFAGDIAFYQRAPTTPTADLDAWQATLARAGEAGFEVLVPGHGPVTHDDAPLRQTGAYLEWLRSRFRAAAADGESAAEIMFAPLPARWQQLAVSPGEYRRSVSHLYPAIEREALRPMGE